MGLILVQFWSVTIMTDFAENLRKFRKNKKYSQAELGRKLHYGSTTIANYESGRNEPSFRDLIRLAEVLDVTPNELLGIEKHPKGVMEKFQKLNSTAENRFFVPLSNGERIENDALQEHWEFLKAVRHEYLKR